MPDNVGITPGTGKTVLADEVVDATLGTGVVQMVKIMDGTLDGTSKAAVGANGLAVDVTSLPVIPAGDNVIGRFKTTDGTNVAAVKAASTAAVAADPALVVAVSPNSPVVPRAADRGGTVTAATGVAATLTLAAPAAGLFHYITWIEMVLYSTAARVGAAAPVLVPTTNLPGSPVYDFTTAGAVGTSERQIINPALPIKSSVAATATTIVAPIVTGGLWRITAYFYVA